MVATTNVTSGDIGRYLAGRECVLGDRLTISTSDPVAAAQAVYEALGPRGRWYVSQMLAELPPCAWPVDADGDRFDYAAVYEVGG